MLMPNSFPARFRGQCPRCRSVIVPSYRSGEGHEVAWIHPHGIAQLVHKSCAKTYLDEKRALS